MKVKTKKRREDAEEAEEDVFVVEYGQKRSGKRKAGGKKMKFEDPPVDEWFPAEVVEVRHQKGDWGPGIKFAFRPTLKSMRKVGWIWGLVWIGKGLTYDSKLYKWACAMAGEKIKLGRGVKVDFEGFVGNVVMIRCEESESISEKTGKPFVNVSGIKARKRKVDSGERPAKKILDDDGGEGGKKKVKKVKKKKFRVEF